MKTKCSFILKTSVAIVLALMMLFGSISTVIAATVDMAGTGALSVAGHIYFIKPSGWSNVSLMVGHSSYSCGYDMSNISGTNLYYINQSAWSDSTEFAFFDVSNWGGENHNIAYRADYSPNESSTNSSYAMNSGSTYLIATTANSPTYYSGGYSALNNTLTVKTMLYNGSSYAETTTTCGTYSATNAKKINGNGSATSSSFTNSNGTGTLSVARTNTATISQTKASGYTFQGWKSSKDTTGSGLSTGDYSFTNSGSNTTIYAYYKVAATPTCSSVSLSQSPSSGTIYNGITSVTYTASATSPVSGVTYNFKVDGTSVQNTTSSTYTTTFTSSGTKSVTVTVEKSGYDSVTSSAVSTTVSDKPTVYFNYNGKETDNPTMTYDATASAAKSNHIVYKLDRNWYGNSTYNIKVYDGSDRFKTSSGSNITDNLPLSGSGYATQTSGDAWIVLKTNTSISDSSTGKYTFYWDFTDKKLYVEYPHVVTFNANGHGSAPSSQIVSYGGKATAPTAPTATGWTFGGWYKESGCTNTWNFSTETVTSNKTLYAKWSAVSTTLTFNTNGATSDGTQTVSGAAAYGSAMPSFTSYTAPTKTGYTLSGWYDATSGGSKYYNADGTSAKNWDKTDTSATLYARWSETTGTVKGAAYTSGSASTTGGTVNNTSITVGIDTSKSITATKKTNYDFNGWQISGTNATKLYYRFSTSDSWTKVSSDGANVGTSSNTTIYIRTDGSSGITTSNAEVRALFTPTTYTGLTAVGKYSTTGASDSYTNTWSSGGPNVTIAAASGNYVTGVAVSAPGTDPTGYQFAGWYTANGSFTNAADKDTTFKPNAANAVAVATYKKIYTITASVDNTGTGAGTVSTSVNSVVAGGSYTITSTAKSGSAIQSILVNGTSKGTNASTTVSSVSANQTVSVKFTSVVDLKGSFDSWGSGQNMVSNAAGTSFSTTVTVNANTATEFKLMNNSNWASSGVDTVDSWVLNGIATHTTSGNNLKITPTVKAKITFVSNGSKFTSITAIPYDSTTYNVTLKKVAGSTITSTYMGTEYTTASADAVVPVYSGTEISFTASAASGKYLSGLTTSAGSLSPAFSVGDSYTGKISNVTSARTVTPSVANKFSITAKTNKSSRGTVSVSPASARPGQTVTITVSPKAGILQTLTYEYAGGKKYTRNFTNNTWDEVSGTRGAVASTSLDKDLGLVAVGANSDIAPLAADATYNFTLDSNPTGAVTVNATFAPYSAESNWYYNGYDTSGNKVTAYWGKQMTEGMVSGEKFSYYHVDGRTGTDHLFTVSDGRVADTRYVYFTRPKSYSYWNQSNSPKAHFWKNGGSSYDTWPGTTMTWVYDNDMGEAVFKIAIPVGADRVSFNDASNSSTQQTVDIDLTNTSGAYYVSGWNNSANKYNYGTWNTGYDDQGYVASGTEYFYDGERYTADYSTKGFNNHYVSSTDYTKPKDLGSSSGDYYVNVLYAGKTYTINGVTKTVGAKDLVIWSKEPLNDDGDTVTVYAKDGAIRSESVGSTYANIADTQIVASASSTTSIGTSQNGNISGQTYETYKAGKGETIYIRTTINDTTGNGADTTTNRNKYYVRGFCINGEVFELKTWDSSGVYTTSYKIPEDYESKYVEITPIYYLKDVGSGSGQHKIVTYRVTGFTDALKEVGAGKPGWGDTLYTYPFYGKLSSNNNALGAYPGQPMVYYKGQYQMQIPEQSTAWDVYLSDSALSGTDAQKKTQIADTNVSGVTMSNGYYDSVHRLIMGYGDNGSSSDHVQTYDYGDFFKIFNEKAPVDNIVFDFKYETKKHNFENQPASSITKSTLDTDYGTNGNGFELLTNFHGRHVDLFGTPLSGDAADPEKTTPVYVVSIGGVNGSAGVENIAGYYATEWMVYGSANGTDYTRITAGGKSSIPPEVLVLNDDDSTSFNTTTYPSADASHTITDWKALYTALEAYRGKPVMISYEAADAQIGSGNYATSGGGGATRNDGRWLYSKNGETITSNIRVDVSEDSGVTYYENPASGETGHVADLEAYFTNAEADGQSTYTTTIDPDKTFDFEAHSNNSDYKFMGWYMADGTKITSDNIGHTERSGSYTFVARFMHFTGGQLILGHKAATDSTYKGAGTATIAVTVKDENDETVREWAASSSDITIDDKIINNENTAYTIEVTLNASGTGEDTYARTTCSAADTFFGDQSEYTTMPQTFSFTVGDLFSGTTQSVKKITYNSFFNQVQYSYKYTFNFTARDGSNKTYVRENTLTAAQREAYVETSGSSRILKEEFVNTLIPHESNFNQSLKWNMTASDRTFTESGNNYTLTKSLTAQPITDSSDPNYRPSTRTATFDLPYAHTNGVPTESDGKVFEDTSTNLMITAAYSTIPKYNDAYIVAPKMLYSGSDSGKYFQYWAVYKTKTSGEYTDSDIVTKCYFNSFNLILYDNYYITPVYASTEYDIANSGTNTTVYYLDTTRNQFNGTGEYTQNTAAGRNIAADLLYNDFALSYNYGDVEIFRGDSDSDAITDLGVVVERVQQLDVKQDGTPYTDPERYEGKGASVSDIESVISGSKITGITKHAITKTSLDNKNRIEIYDAFYNSGGWDHDKQAPVGNYAYKKYVYKAYSYMVVDSVITLSNPVYFTMYDEATK